MVLAAAGGQYGKLTLDHVKLLETCVLSLWEQHGELPVVQEVLFVVGPL